MAKVTNARVRIEPVSLNETTLETNIVSEISALFRFPTSASFPTRLRWFFGIPQRSASSTPTSKKVKIYRLTPPEEYHGGGWDSKIVIPNGDGTKRAIFIQFKAGKHCDGNSIPNSIFNFNIKDPNQHAAFSFNDNSNNNQHQTLKNLQEELVRQGLPSKSVLYGFPRITDLTTFDNLEEDLILHTTFLSIGEMDVKAAANGATLYDNQMHYFRTCYFDESRREISSNPFLIGNLEEQSGLIFEILLVRIANWRNQLIREMPIELINQEIYFIVADFLRINPFELYDFERFLPLRFEQEFKLYYKELEANSLINLRDIFGENSNFYVSIEWRKVLFKRITEFFDENQSREINIQNEIPNEYSFSLTEEKRLELNYSKDANYNLLVF